MSDRSPQASKKRVPTRLILTVSAILLAIGVAGFIIGIQREKKSREAVQPADRAVCLQAARLTKAAESGSLSDAGQPFEALTMLRAADAQLEAGRAHATALIDSAETRGRSVSPDTALRIAEAGANIRERCVELKAAKRSEFKN